MGKKTAILEEARTVKQESTEMRAAYLGGEEDPLDGFEFRPTMAGRLEREVVRCSIVAATPSWQEVLDGALKLAAAEDPAP